MSPRLGLFALVVSVVGTGAFALLHSDPPPPREAEEPRAITTEMASPSPAEALPAGHPAIDKASSAEALPPGHPAIDKASSKGPPVPANNESATLAWTVPPGWETAANPSAMRIATYRIPHAPGDTEDGEMSVMRAGGTTEANIQRWLGQFDDAGKEERLDKTVHGLHVAIVGVNGTFLGSGMTPTSAPAPRPGWGLVAAIVEASGSPYFFKLTGPAATLRRARPSFDGLIASLAAK